MKIRTLSFAALLALALPASALAQSSSSRAGGFGATVLLGMEAGDADTGFSLRADGVLGEKPLAPRVLLSGVLSLGYTRYSYGYADPYYPDRVDAGVNLFKIYPAARFTFDVAPILDLYADAGIGLYIDSASTHWHDRYGVYYDTSHTDAGLGMRFAGGAMFKVTNGLRLGAEIGLNPYFGDYEDTTFSLMFGAMFRM